MKLLLSDAMELGHTLIGEIRNKFISLDKKCGCAIGSVAAAIGKCEELYYYLTANWLHLYYPWTKADVSTVKITKDNLPYDIDVSFYKSYNISAFISVLHHRYVVPRLEIAKLIRAIEPPDSGYEVEETEVVEQHYAELKHD